MGGLALLLVVWHASIMPGAARCLLPAAKVNLGVQQQTAAVFSLSIRFRRNACGIKCHCLCVWLLWLAGVSYLHWHCALSASMFSMLLCFASVGGERGCMIKHTGLAYS